MSLQQWTQYIENLLARLSVNGDSTDAISNVFEYADDYPYSVYDSILPETRTGYVYLLASVRNLDTTYVGQTIHLKRRFSEHNSGNGSTGTCNASDRPWALVGYICGLGHLDQSGRMALETKWRQYIQLSQNRGTDDIMTKIREGERVVEEWNDLEQEQEKKIRFVRMIRRNKSRGNDE